jgi:hypothetical protein
MIYENRILISPDCSAKIGKGVNMTTAIFNLNANDCCGELGEEPDVTEIFGFFSAPGDKYAEDIMQTDIAVMPEHSELSVLAHRIEEDPIGVAERRIGELLSQRVAVCMCETPKQCPALSTFALLAALKVANG